MSISICTKLYNVPMFTKDMLKGIPQELPSTKEKAINITVQAKHTDQGSLICHDKWRPDG